MITKKGAIMNKPTYKKIGDSHYEVSVNGRKLCSVIKQQSATRTYWFIDEVFRGFSRTYKLKGQPRDHFPVRTWDQTRESVVVSTFPLELGITHGVDLSKYEV